MEIREGQTKVGESKAAVFPSRPHFSIFSYNTDVRRRKLEISSVCEGSRGARNDAWIEPIFPRNFLVWREKLLEPMRNDSCVCSSRDLQLRYCRKVLSGIGGPTRS